MMSPTAKGGPISTGEKTTNNDGKCLGADCGDDSGEEAGNLK